MIKKMVVLMILVTLYGTIQGQSKSVKTIYNVGEFVTDGSVVVNAPLVCCNYAFDRFMDEFKSGDVDILFEWAFKGLGRQIQGDDVHNAFLIDIKSMEFDNLSDVSTVDVDLEALGRVLFKNVIIKSKVVHHHLADGSQKIDVDFFYSNIFIKRAYGTFFARKISGNQSQIRIEVHLQFGWFFNIFVTRRRYNDVIAWRVGKLLDNFKNESEKCVPFP